MRSRLAAIATLASLFIFFWYVLLPHDQSASSSSGSGSKSSKKAIFNSQSQSDASNLHVAPELLHGASIMPHLGNETAKYVVVPAFPPPPPSPPKSNKLIQPTIT